MGGWDGEGDDRPFAMSAKTDNTSGEYKITANPVFYVQFVSQLLCAHIIVIVISEFIERHSKVKRTRAPAYSRAWRRIKGVVER